MIARLRLVLLLILASGAAVAQPVFPNQPGLLGRSYINNDPMISTLDSLANGGVRMYGDLQEFDAVACYNVGGVQCQIASAATGDGSSLTITGVTLPVWIVGGNLVTILGTNVAASTTITSFTGTPGGAGTITVNNLPTGALGTINFQQPKNVIDFPLSGTTSTTVTAVKGSNTLTLGSSAFCVAKIQGQPLYIAGITAPGTLLAGCLSSNKIALSLPITADPLGATFTVQYGVNFQATCPPNPASVGVTGCVGSYLTTPFWLSAGSAAQGDLQLITAVNSSTNITYGSNSAVLVNTNAAHFLVGHDDSAGATAACGYALARNLILDVPVNHFTPALGRTCYDIKLRGFGRLATGGDTLKAAATVFPEPIVPAWDAPLPSPPKPGIIARLHLPNMIAAGRAPIAVSTYDSLGAPNPNNYNSMDAYPAALLRAIMTQNPLLAPAMKMCGVGGATMANFNGNPNQTGTPCITGTGTSFLSQIAAYTTPNAVLVGGTNNDREGFDPLQMVDAWGKITLPSANGGAFTNGADWIAVVHHPYSRINTNAGSTSPIEIGMEYASGWLSSFCAVMRCGKIDAAVEGIKHLWGYDPLATAFEKRFDIVSSVIGNLALPTTYPRLIHGAAITVGKTAQAGAAFWANFTGGSVTDSRGPFIAFKVGSDGSLAVGNWVWIFQIAGPTFAVQCDLTPLLPGLGCADPATGKPPVIPSLKGTITVPAGASPVVTTSAANWGWTCPAAGATVAIPQAGTAQSIPGHGAYTEPWITTTSACTTTSVTLVGTAPTPGTYTNSFVMLGNPVISTGVVDVGDGSGNEAWGVEWKGEDFLMWCNVKNTPCFTSKLMRPRAAYSMKIVSGGTNPVFPIAADPSNSNLPLFSVAVPVANLTILRDSDINGPASNILLNSVGIGPSGGDGNNHNTSRFGAGTVAQLIAANDLSFPSAGGITTVVPTTGQTITVPASTGSYIVSPAGTLATLTVVLPLQSYKLGDVLDISFNQIITALTITPGTGQTVNGAAVTTAALGATLRYKVTGVRSGNVVTWQRIQ